MRLEVESFCVGPRIDALRSVPIHAVIFDKDLTLTEEAERGDTGSVVLRSETLFWADRIKLIPETISLIEELRVRGIKTGLLTNDRREATDEVLERFGLTDYFDATVARREADGQRKPHPAPFVHIAQLLKVDPKFCVMVGDEPSDDIVGAKRAGMRSVLVPREEHIAWSGEWGVEPDLVLLSRRGLNLTNLMQI